MAADGSGRRAGRIEQHRVERAPRRPCRGVGLDELGLELQPLEIGPQPCEPRLREIDGGDVGAGRGELRRLAAGRRAQIGDRAASDSAEQAGGQRGGGVLHPPGAVRIAGEILDAAAGGKPHRSRRQREAAEALGPCLQAPISR